MMDSDLRDLITDPDLGGTSFWYGRITETVDGKGRAHQVEQVILAEGNIQPAPGKEREVLEEGDRLKAAVIIYTPAPLTVGENKEKADRVYHDGGVYRVSLAEPWQYAFGFTKAVAVLEREGNPNE